MPPRCCRRLQSLAGDIGNLGLIGNGGVRPERRIVVAEVLDVPRRRVNRNDLIDAVVQAVGDGVRRCARAGGDRRAVISAAPRDSRHRARIGAVATGPIAEPVMFSAAVAEALTVTATPIALLEICACPICSRQLRVALSVDDVPESIREKIVVARIGSRREAARTLLRGSLEDRIRPAAIRRQTGDGRSAAPARRNRQRRSVPPHVRSNKIESPGLKLCALT